MRRFRSLGLAAGATALLCVVMVWRLPADAALAAEGEATASPRAAPVPRAAAAASAGTRVTPVTLRGSDTPQGRLVRERDGQLYEDFPDGRRVLHTTVRMRDASGREWDEPVEIEAAPVDARKRDVPAAR